MSMWDQRYSGIEYHFGTRPAAFLERTAGLLPVPSKVLCIADGEGRNSVHLASLGHAVEAMDASSVGIEKARALALAAGVTLRFTEADIARWPWAPDSYDAVVAVFIQFAGPDLRRAIWAGIRRTLRPGGRLLLHGYALRQLANGTGGPPFPENLYTPAILREELDGFQIDSLDDYDAEIHEGSGHSGRSALIDLIATRPG